MPLYRPTLYFLPYNLMDCGILWSSAAILVTGLGVLIGERAAEKYITRHQIEGRVATIRKRIYQVAFIISECNVL